MKELTLDLDHLTILQTLKTYHQGISFDEIVLLWNYDDSTLQELLSYLQQHRFIYECDDYYYILNDGKRALEKALKKSK